MKVQTPFVVLSTSKESINKLFKEGITSKSLLDIAKKSEDLVLFDSVSNNSFISLRQKFGKNSNGSIELKLIDVPGDFEAKIFQPGIDNQLSVIESAASEIGDLTEIDYTVEPLVDYPDDPSEFKLVEKKVVSKEKVIKEAVNYRQKIKNNFQKSVFYIGYGFGTNVQYWNGPQLVYLTNAELDIASSKVITLRFQPIINAISTTNPLNDLFKKNTRPDTKGLRLQALGKSGPIDMSNWDLPNKEIYSSPFLKNTNKQQIKSIFPKVDLHILICDVIRDYIKTVTKSDRVIVLLPDLNVLLSDLVKSFEGSNFPALPSSRFLASIRKVVEYLGMDFSMEPTLNTNQAKPAVTGQKAQAEMKDTAGGAIGADKNPIGKREDHYSRYTRYVKINKTYTENDIIDSKEILKNILNAIYQESGGRISSYFTHYENKQEVIDYWTKDEKLRNHPIFASLPKESSSTVTVFGDFGLIKSFLLGNLNLNTISKAYLDKSFKDFPIHHLDKEILTDKEYNASIRSRSKISITEVDENFNSLYDSSFDDFSVADELKNVEGIRDFIASNSVPVFRYNIKNPNVKKLGHRFNKQYFSQIALGFNRDFSVQISNTFTNKFLEEYIKVGSVSPEALAEYINQKQLINESLTKEEIADQFIKQVNEVNQDQQNSFETLPDLISEALTLIEENPNFYKIKVPQGIPLTRDKLMYDFAREMYSKTNQIFVESLPFFHINNSFIGNGCFVFADIPQPTKAGRTVRTNYNQFISGYYSIFEFEHIIDSNSCRSTFGLVKNLEQSNLNENEEPINDDSFDIGTQEISIDDPSFIDGLGETGILF